LQIPLQSLPYKFVTLGVAAPVFLKIMTAFETKSLQSYSQEDVQQILQLAITRQAGEQDKEFTYEQILEIAAELDIAPEILKLAEQDWHGQKSEAQKRQAFDSYRWRKFKKRLGSYAIINIFIGLVDLISGGGLSWSLYILLFCGLASGLNVWNIWQLKGEEYEIAFQKWNHKHQLRQTINTVLNKWFKNWGF
jgi:hypothetical protein